MFLNDFLHRKLTFKVQFRHYLTNHNSLQDGFKKKSLEHVDSWANILHFRTHHLYNYTTKLTCRVFYEEVVYWRWRTVLQYCASWVLSMPFYIAFLTYFGSLVLKQIKGHQWLWKRKKNVNLLFDKAFQIVPRLSSVSFKISIKILNNKTKRADFFWDAPNNPIFFA